MQPDEQGDRMNRGRGGILTLRAPANSSISSMLGYGAGGVALTGRVPVTVATSGARRLLRRLLR